MPSESLTSSAPRSPLRPALPATAVRRVLATVAAAAGITAPAGLVGQEGSDAARVADAAREADRGGAAWATPAPGTLWIHPARFEKEDGTLGEAQRGVLFVPVDRDDVGAPADGAPAGDAAAGGARNGAAPGTGLRTIGLEFWRFPAAPEASGDTPPIFVLRGGPGWPGLEGDLEREGFFERDVEPLTRIADVVYVGQRGIGSSRPNTACRAPLAPDEERAEAREGQAAGETAAASDEEQRRLVREAAAECRRWWEARGLDLQGFTVVEAAADVDAVRRVLGYERIVLTGGSFGSHWAMAVLRYHPDMVARTLISGTEGPDHTYDSPTGVLNVFDRIAEDAEDSPRLEGRVPEGGLMGALREVLQRLERDPVTVTVALDAGESDGGEGEDGDAPETEDVRLDGEAARDLADGYLGSVDGRRREASWPAGVLLLHRGEYERAARSEAGGGGGDGGFWPTASFFMLDCGSGITAEREALLVADTARAVVGEQNWYYRAVCPAWDADLGDDFRTGFRTDVPTVIVHGDWDVSTPIENAREMLPAFSDATFVLVERGSHGALGEALRHSAEFREGLQRFLATGDRGGLPERVELPEPEWVLPEELDGSEEGG